MIAIHISLFWVFDDIALGMLTVSISLQPNIDRWTSRKVEIVLSSLPLLGKNLFLSTKLLRRNDPLGKRLGLGRIFIHILMHILISSAHSFN